MPYMNIVNKITPIMRLNLENTTSHQRTLLTIKGHQINSWRQIRKSMRDAFAKYQKNECFIYCMFRASNLCLES
jgi:tmRNA-binding protein